MPARRSSRPAVHLAKRVHTRCEAEPLQLALAALGWKETSHSDAKIVWDVWLNDAEGHLHDTPTVTQILNRFPAMADCCRKACFARLHARLRALGSVDDGLYIPKQWALPQQKAELATHVRERAKAPTGKASAPVYIVKPDSGSQGDGIQLTPDPCKASWDESKDRVVQEYIGAPMLLDGLKFDLRLYVLVTSVSPLRAFLCREGLARFAVDSYTAPTRENMRNVHVEIDEQ